MWLLYVCFTCVELGLLWLRLLFGFDYDILVFVYVCLAFTGAFNGIVIFCFFSLLFYCGLLWFVWLFGVYWYVWVGLLLDVCLLCCYLFGLLEGGSCGLWLWFRVVCLC